MRRGATPGCVRSQAAAPWLAGLKALRLTRTGLTLAGLRRLLDSPHLPRPRSLDLDVNSFGDEGVGTRTAQGRLPQLLAELLHGQQRDLPPQSLEAVDIAVEGGDVAVDLLGDAGDR